MKRRAGIVKVEQDPSVGAFPYGKPQSGKGKGKRPVLVTSRYKAKTSLVNIRVGPRSVRARRPNEGHHIDIKMAPQYWEKRGKRTGAPKGKKQRRGEMG